MEKSIIEVKIKTDDPNNTFKTSTLEIQLKEKYNGDKLKAGTLKARIVKCTIDGHSTNVRKPVDLGVMAEQARKYQVMAANMLRKRRTLNRNSLRGH